MASVDEVRQGALEGGVVFFEVTASDTPETAAGPSRVMRRYNDFATLQSALPPVPVAFPGKSFFKKKLACGFEQRRADALGKWLKACVEEYGAEAEVRSFLGLADGEDSSACKKTVENLRGDDRKPSIGTKLRADREERERVAQEKAEREREVQAEARREALARKTAEREAKLKAEADAREAAEQEKREAEVAARLARHEKDMKERAEAAAKAQRDADERAVAEREAVLAARRERHEAAAAETAQEKAGADGENARDRNQREEREEVSRAARAQEGRNRLAQEARHCRNLEHEQLSRAQEAAVNRSPEKAAKVEKATPESKAKVAEAKPESKTPKRRPSVEEQQAARAIVGEVLLAGAKAAEAKP